MLQCLTIQQSGSELWDAYNTHKVSIKEKLKTALSKIHISFDLWTSGNCLSLNGIVAHFVDADFKPQEIV
jgi:hypothetical protein